MKTVSRTAVRNEFSCPEVNRKKVCDLLWSAFPGRSEAEVSRRASAYLSVHERTVRNWMRGVGGPDMVQASMLGGLVGYEVFLRIIFGGRK